MSDRTSFAELIVVPVDDGGVVVDTGSGNVSTVNSSALLILELVIAGASRNNVAAALADKYQLSMPDAHDAVSTVLGHLEALAEPHSGWAADGPVRLQPADQHLHAMIGDRALISIDQHNKELGLLDPMEPAFLAQVLLALAPKLAAADGQLVLHGSAVQTEAGAFGFIGRGGVGKTTTARAFGDAGARVLAEDLLFVDQEDGPTPQVICGAESAARTWAREAARQLLSTQRPIPYPYLALGSERTRLRGLWVLDGSRGDAEDFLVQPIAAPDLICLFLRHSFISSGDPLRLRLRLSTLARLAASLQTGLLSPPNGLPWLRAAAVRSLSSQHKNRVKLFV